MPSNKTLAIDFHSSYPEITGLVQDFSPSSQSFSLEGLKMCPISGSHVFKNPGIIPGFLKTWPPEIGHILRPSRLKEYASH